MVITKYVKLKTKGNTDIIDITDEVAELINETPLKNGIVTIFVPGSTGAVTTMEYEPGLIDDLIKFFEEFIQQHKHYSHNRSHFDGNAHSHLRAAILGPSLTIPFVNKRLILGTWQQIVFIDFDTRPRSREIILQISGE